MIREPHSLTQIASWVIRDKVTKQVITEIYSAKRVARLNTEKYEAVPILEYLGEINGNR